jgi:hypothetical protein
MGLRKCTGVVMKKKSVPQPAARTFFTLLPLLPYCVERSSL